jgi:hypothetical protein
MSDAILVATRRQTGAAARVDRNEVDMSERSERIIGLSAVVPHGGTERSGVAA